ncbi:hypothetical protein QUB80_28860 [Chlorogloeopsis sp. ULAP01]|jgi:HSP20 family protein|nr:hypothetical protein [Chlorogloeopsis sp. ULAP01]MDM9384675.1 hypothetical protein [Chlorogloeopsis sp. ULAP01]
MVLVRYNPWQELNTLQRQIDGALEDFQAPTFNKAPVANCTKPKIPYI